MTEREKLIEAMARAICDEWSYLWAATAALAAIEAMGAVVVPVEATGAMLESADDALCGVAVGDLAHDIAGDTYAAMCRASPYSKETRA
jgi:hypothetical protein